MADENKATSYFGKVGKDIADGALKATPIPAATKAYDSVVDTSQAVIGQARHVVSGVANAATDQFKAIGEKLEETPIVGKFVKGATDKIESIAKNAKERVASVFEKPKPMNAREKELFKQFLKEEKKIAIELKRERLEGTKAGKAIEKTQSKLARKGYDDKTIVALTDQLSQPSSKAASNLAKRGTGLGTSKPPFPVGW